ncbi:hypothetical protein GOP47_0010142 [Adiantum capillus-veneris]|uniref:Uncharacterized protein n=1 Tax=Adiantum capillus-veneris TaxID=13818 RepID=A0A9D4UU89_ADICA|nr:hypothetical protein GOP47_0010142 [Adiantum capillus-veneris]
MLLECTESDIENLSSSLLMPLQSVKLKLALRKQKEEEIQSKFYKGFIKFLGKVVTKFNDGSLQVGNATLVGKHRIAVTAKHILEEDDTGDLCRKRNKNTIQR